MFDFRGLDPPYPEKVTARRVITVAIGSLFHRVCGYRIRRAVSKAILSCGRSMNLHS